MINPSTPLLLGDIASGLVVEGTGTVKWSFYSDNGALLTLHLKAFYVPTCKQRLLSPQKIFCPTENVRGTFVISSSHAQLLLDDSPILTVPYDPMNGLPTSQAILLHHGISSPQVNLCVTEEVSQNLPEAQKEYLRWHFRLGHLNSNIIQWHHLVTQFLLA